MWKFLFLLGGTITLRPYVFVFLGAYLLLATLHLGAGRAVAFLALGYLISWAAELCAINFGFPFGEYLYIPATLDRELWVAGVPFMDSLSYVFLAYASYCLALTALSPGRGGQIQDGPRPAHPNFGGGAHGHPGHYHRPRGPAGLPLVPGADLRLPGRRGLFRGHHQQLCRLVPGGPGPHPGAAIPDLRAGPGAFLGLGPPPLHPQACRGPPFTWESWDST